MEPSILAPQAMAQALALPAAFYCGTPMHRIDQACIFNQSWQLAGHEAQLPEIGSHLPIEVAGKPILLVRETAQIIRAFYNVCVHRAGPLALAPGKGKSLRCKYHGWTYRLNGQLQGAPEMSENQGFNPCNFHLKPVRCETWEGFIFVALGERVPPLTDLLDGISTRIVPIDLKPMNFHNRQVYDIQCNWKVYVDNYLEGYHLPHVHPGLSRLLKYQDYDTELQRWYSYQFSPLEDETNFYGQGMAHYFFVYPNLMLNILPNRIQTNLVLPLNAHTCRVVFDFYYASMDQEALARMAAEDARFSDEIQWEDIHICQQVMQGLQSGAYQPGPLCRKRELGVYHFQELLRTAYRENPSAFEHSELNHRE